MPMVTLHKVGEGNLYHMHVLDAVDPGFGSGRPGGVDPGWGQGRPGGRPDQGLPGSGAIPDHDLPDNPPPTLLPGYTLVMVRGPHGKWEYAFIAPSDPPPRPLPPGNIEHPGNRPPGQGMPPRPDQGLPIQPGHPGNVVPGQPVIGGGPIEPRPPHISGQPVPPVATPQNR